MKRLTRDLVSRMERDLGMPLEWVAAAHYNTEHPHVHMALYPSGLCLVHARLPNISCVNGRHVINIVLTPFVSMCREV